MFVHTVIMVIEPHMKQGRQHKLISTIFLATSVTKKLDHNKRIKQLLSEQNYTIREVQGAFGFENPQAIYKWIAGKSLPSLDNFIILSRLLHTSIENILVIDGDIPRLWVSLNQWFNDIFSLLPYNRVIRK